MNNFKKAIAIFILFFICCQSAQAQESTKQEILNVNLSYKDKQVAIVSIDRRTGFLPDYLNQPESGYKLQVWDKDYKEVAKVTFIFHSELAGDEFRQDGIRRTAQPLSEANQTITIPYSPNINKLTVQDPEGKTLLSQDFKFDTFQTYEESQQKEQAASKKAKVPQITSTAVLGTVILLGVIIAGFYLYKKHQSTTPTNNNSQNNPNIAVKRAPTIPVFGTQEQIVDEFKKMSKKKS